LQPDRLIVNAYENLNMITPLPLLFLGGKGLTELSFLNGSYGDELSQY
jgi:hypothetical protein